MNTVDRRRTISLVATGVVVFASLPFLRLGYLKEPLMGMDEAIYMVVADVLNRGGRLYLDIWDHKPPGIYLLYQAILRLDHQPLAVHATALLLAMLNAWLLFRLTRRLQGAGRALIAVWLFSVYTSAFWAAALNAEAWLILLQLGALLLLTGPARTRMSPLRPLLAGLLFGCAFMIKYVALLPLLGVAGWLAWRQRRREPAATDYRAGEARPGMALPGWPLVLIGSAAAPLAGIAYCLATGVLAEFLRSAVGYNTDYVVKGAWSLFMEYGRFFLWNYAREQWPLLALGLLGLARWVWSGRRASPTSPKLEGEDAADPGGSPRTSPTVSNQDAANGFGIALMAVWTAGSLLAALSPLKFLDHYFLLTIPGCCFFAAIPFGNPRSNPRRRGWLAAAAILLAFTVVPAGGALRQSLARWNTLPLDVGASDYPPAAIGRHIQSITRPGDRILVWRGDVDIYFYARRDPAIRFFFWPHLLRDYLPPGGTGTVARDLANTPPRWILVGTSAILAGRRYPPIENYIEQKCVPAGQFGDYRLFRAKSGSGNFYNFPPPESSYLSHLRSRSTESPMLR